ncbi:HNH endonuclease [Micromonospora echinospora]|uniref:HNH endonuclease n=1 Tax=Micromonospora echinospora TaxID=1877 RepID=UPI0037AFD62B
MIFSMPKPARDNEADYRVALSRRGEANKSLLAPAQEEVFEAYRKYDQAQGVPHLIKAIAVDEACAKALRSNYPLTYSGKCLQEISEQAFAAAPYDLCPMCGRVTPTTIDHFLPQEKYPEFSLLSYNLVPVCPDCNRYKSTLTGSDRQGRFFHAYYDEAPTDAPLLKSDIGINKGVLITFSVNHELPDEIYRNARYQFEKLRLGKLYPRASVAELLERHDAFSTAFAAGGATAVAREAKRIGKSIQRKLGRQYWKVALYDGIALSKQFCDGGFALLGAKPSTRRSSRLPSTRSSADRAADQPPTPRRS